MKIALIGYGKMGHMLEAIARQRGHSIAVTLDADQPVEHHLDTLRTAEVALEFTAPAAALGNVLACASIGLPVVCGTTGWYGELEKAKAAAFLLGQLQHRGLHGEKGMRTACALPRCIPELRGEHR